MMQGIARLITTEKCSVLASKYAAIDRQQRYHLDRLSSSTATSSHQRVGFTLIEMVVAISMLTVMLTLAGMTFHLLLRSEKLVSQSFVTERGISRLAIQFRDDVHQSETGDILGDTDSGKLEFALGDSKGVRIRYVVTPEGLIRLIVESDEIASREDFRLPDCRVSFAKGQDADPLMRALVIQRSGAVLIQKQSQPTMLRSLRIEADLNRQKIAARASMSPAQDALKPTTTTNATENPQ